MAHCLLEGRAGGKTRDRVGRSVPRFAFTTGRALWFFYYCRSLLLTSILLLCALVTLSCSIAVVIYIKACICFLALNTLAVNMALALSSRWPGISQDVLHMVIDYVPDRTHRWKFAHICKEWRRFALQVLGRRVSNVLELCSRIAPLNPQCTVHSFFIYYQVSILLTGLVIGI